MPLPTWQYGDEPGGSDGWEEVTGSNRKTGSVEFHNCSLLAPNPKYGLVMGRGTAGPWLENILVSGCSIPDVPDRGTGVNDIKSCVRLKAHNIRIVGCSIGSPSGDEQSYAIEAAVALEGTADIRGNILSATQYPVRLIGWRSQSVSNGGRSVEIRASAPPYSDVPPGTDYFDDSEVGDIVWNTQPSSHAGWICTAEGEGGVAIWKPFGSIDSG